VFFSSLLAVQLFSLEVHAETPETEPVPAAIAMLSPFGVPQFLNGRKGLGFTFGGLQVLGLGGAIYTGVRIRSLAIEGDVDTELPLRYLSVLSVVTVSAAWFSSVMDGSHARDVALEKAHAARSWEAVQGRSLEVSGISGSRP
jgi:hypothetical protein